MPMKVAAAIREPYVRADVAVTLAFGTQWGVLRDDAPAKRRHTEKRAADAEPTTS